MTDQVVSIKENISPNLFIRKNAISFFETKIECIPLNDIKIDFSDIKSISHSFAHQYITNKRKSSKNIIEINMPEKINRIMEIAKDSLDNKNEIESIYDAEEIQFDDLNL